MHTWRLGVVGTLVAVLGGCERAGEQTAAPDVGAARAASTSALQGEAPFRVALVTPGPITDRSWNGGAYAGLAAVRDSLGAQVHHTQTRAPAEVEESLRRYGAQGYALVLGLGSEFQQAALRVAPNHPRTLYLTVLGDSTAANVAGMTFSLVEPSYLAGVMAGRITRSNVVGVIGGTESPDVRSSFAAFRAGARTANPRVRVLSSFVGSQGDIGAGKEQALAQIGRGADVLFQRADAAGLGVFQAARERGTAEAPVYVFGSNVDQNGVAPEVTLGSVVVDLPRAFVRVAREVKAGTFRPQVVRLGPETRVVTFVLNPTLAGRIPAPVRAAVDSVERAIAAGTLTPLPGSERDGARPRLGSGVKVSESAPGGG